MSTTKMQMFANIAYNYFRIGILLLLTLFSYWYMINLVNEQYCLITNNLMETIIMTKAIKTPVKALPAAKATVAPVAAKPVKQVANKTDYNAKLLTQAKAAQAKIEARKAVAADKAALNTAFNSKLATARPVFQDKFNPLNLDAHNPQSASERDDAFLYALKTVYAKKPFTHIQSGADSGCLARAINLGNVAILAANETGDLQFQVI